MIKAEIAGKEPIYATWAGSFSEGKYDDHYEYYTLPDGRIPTKITFYFNETPYADYPYFGSVWPSTDPVSGSIKILTPGSSFSINQERANWMMGVASDGRPYTVQRADDSGGARYHWNVALTLEY
jgi:hypothetical protein